MSGIPTVEQVERTTEDGVPVVNVTADPGGGALATFGHFTDPGVDAPPLPGDSLAISDCGGTGESQAVGYSDTKNPGKAANGERRTYARDANGDITAEIWSKANGNVEITSIKSGGKIILNGVEIDQQGNITTPGNVDATGEVTAMAGSMNVALSAHTHGDAMGGTTPPLPGA